MPTLEDESEFNVCLAKELQEGDLNKIINNIHSCTPMNKLEKEFEVEERKNMVSGLFTMRFDDYSLGQDLKRLVGGGMRLVN